MINEELKAKAKTCLECPICRRARKNQRGLAYLFVRLVERKGCPSCKAFEEVTGQRAFDPITQDAIDRIMG
ncbi:MAG: hypothetical protein ABFD49_02555 [Armatimonadota bacterium]|nr:hypothetical protein [bacterium]